MSNKYYPMTDYKSVTDDVDVYIKDWRDLAAPIESACGVVVSGFDPSYAFTETDKNGNTRTVELPTWFVRKLNAALSKK